MRLWLGSARPWARRLARGTVWDTALLEQEVPRRFRGIYTTVLPLEYATIAAFASVVLGSRTQGAIARISSGQYADLWTLAIAVLSVLAGIGLCFRLERLELVATLVLVAGLVTYPIANIIIGAHEGNLLQMGLGIVLFQLIYFPVWRLFDIARTARRRDA